MGCLCADVRWDILNIFKFKFNARIRWEGLLFNETVTKSITVVLKIYREMKIYFTVSGQVYVEQCLSIHFRPSVRLSVDPSIPSSSPSFRLPDRPSARPSIHRSFLYSTNFAFPVYSNAKLLISISLVT